MDERLVVLNEEGVYRVYDLQGDYQQYSLGTEAGELGVVDARIHENGLVAMTGSLTLLEVKEWEGSRPLILANPGESIITHICYTQTYFEFQVLRSCPIHGL
jgi:hypothetical protein